MLTRHARGTLRHLVAPAALSMGALALLTGCSLLGPAGTELETRAAGATEAAADAVPVEVDDCINDPGPASVPDIAVLPCSEPHVFEAFASTQMPDGDYPGVAAANTAAGDYCAAEFARYVGLEYDASVLTMLYFYPVEENWNSAEDRRILCFVAEEGEIPVTGSLRNAGR